MGRVWPPEPGPGLKSVCSSAKKPPLPDPQKSRKLAGKVLQGSRAGGAVSCQRGTCWWFGPRGGGTSGSEFWTPAFVSEPLQHHAHNRHVLPIATYVACHKT